jgi:cell division protein ZapE
VTVARKRRVHFHQFMLEIHERLHRLESEHLPDLLPRVAREIAAETWLLCFDEFHVSNIADAMILGRLFEALFKAGVVVVATSNWPPDQLYKNGLQRERFLPFIDLIQQHMRVYYLDGAVDHRFEQTQKLPGCFYPLSRENTQKLQNIFFQLTDNAEPKTIELPVQGRILRIIHAAKGVGFFNFDELCVTALGPADYLALAENFHTVLIDGVPPMRAEARNETIRFINLIDALYEANTQLYLTAAASPEQLAPPGELNFPFQRTLSRLMEMQGEEYRKKAHLCG